MEHLRPHTTRTVQEQDWGGLDNGELLTVAQADFDVLITSDANMKYQRSLAQYDIALIVLRAFSNSFEDYYPLVPEILETLEGIQSGEAVYLYTSDKLRLKDERKGRR